MYQDYLVTDPELKGFIDQIPIAMARERFDKRRVEINQTIAEAVENACLGGMEVKLVLEQAAKKAQSELNR